MMLEQVIPEYKNNKIYLYRKIDEVIENLEDKILHNVAIDLYGMLTIIISNGHIQISTLYMVLKSLVEVCNKYDYYNPFPYDKNKEKNFMNKISRIVLKEEKEFEKNIPLYK